MVQGAEGLGYKPCLKLKIFDRQIHSRILSPLLSVSYPFMDLESIVVSKVVTVASIAKPTGAMNKFLSYVGMTVCL